jgi:hypothetical protein
MGECRTAEGVSVLSDSEVLVMVVTIVGEDPVRNNSEYHKMV